MPNTVDVEIAGRRFRLLAGRGLYWPEQGTLFVADVHLGKDATFGRGGIPVPAGSTEGTLRSIAGVLQQTGATRLCILGDLFHARGSLSPRVRGCVESFLEGFSDLTFLLVRGNHDRHVGRLPLDWPITVVEPGARIAGVTLGHAPSEQPGDAELYLCGHVHPVIQIRSGNESLGRLPCFWHSGGCMVLPAIGEFTGGHIVRPGRGDGVWLIADDRIHRHAVRAGATGGSAKR